MKFSTKNRRLTTETIMSIPDWAFERGIENDAWVQERFGDDNDDDDDDWDDDYRENDKNYPPKSIQTQNNNFKKEKNIMSEKKFFEKIPAINSKGNTPSDALEKIKEVLNRPDIFAINYSDEKYTVYIQPEVSELSLAFEVKLPQSTECKNVIEATQLLNSFIERIKELEEKIAVFYKDDILFKENSINFLNPYETNENFNIMLINICKYLGNEEYSFEKLQKICYSLTKELKLTELDETIKKLTEASKHDNAEKYINIRQAIKNSGYFTKETFAMLYVNLEQYVIFEKALSKFLTEGFHYIIVE